MNSSAKLCFFFRLNLTHLLMSLAALFIAENARATIYFWDPEGVSGGDPILTSLSQTWENKVWTTYYNGTATQTYWVDTSAGNIADFAVHSGSSTPPFTVTMNANHTVSGIYAGVSPTGPCNVTISGPGTMFLPSGLQGFLVYNAAQQGYSSLTLDVTLADETNASGGLALEGSGEFVFNGVNTYSGGTYLGFGGGTFDGILSFNNGASFGSGNSPIVLASCAGALLAEGSAAITIENPISVGGAQFPNPPAGQILNIAGNAGGVTFSGPVNLNTNLTELQATGIGNVVVFSGVISGSVSGSNAGGVIFGGSSTIELENVETYPGATEVARNGTLALGPGSALLGGGTVTVLTGGTLADWNSTGSNAIAGALTLNSGASASFTGAGGASNTIGALAAGGNVALNGNPMIVNVAGSPLAAGNYALIRCAGVVSGVANAGPSMTGQGIAAGLCASIVTTDGPQGSVVLRVQPPSTNAEYSCDAAGNLNLTFHGSPGINFVIQESSPTPNGLWSNIMGPLPADITGQISLSVSNPVAPSFYRLKLP